MFALTLFTSECLSRPNVNYIGVTPTSLSRRLTMHLANGAIKQHTEKIHNLQ